MVNRKPIPKKIRQLVHQKYDGHCAYCGKKIAYKDMQVDHVIAYAESIYSGTPEDRARIQRMIEDGSINSMENLMPACRKCNFYKSSLTIEEFRTAILQELSKSCIKSFQTQLAMQYGILTYHLWDGQFYFEKTNKQNETKHD